MSIPTSDQSGSAPIAIVGVGLRFPGGVRTLAQYGRFLAAGAPAIGPVPAERWGGERSGTGPGRTAHHVGAFLPDVDRFDAAYFGVPPREADVLDPQHRLFLEVAWEAMSDAGRPREDWRGSRTGVVVGILANDYSALQARTLGPDAIGPHHATGLEFSFAAGRLAYTFDLHGPAQGVNTACSSSLVAVHLAAQSLRTGECDTAVAGGVSLQLTPDNSVFLSSVGALSPSGRCLPFDQAADGIVRGEGCGAVVLRRLEDALADGDRIYAVIRGSAVNNDGSSLGLTVPNGEMQTDLVRTALSRAGLEASDVDYVEAHGTGTPLGDLIELDALSRVYGAGHTPQRPMFVGSHKALLGHMDAAAGIGGLLKAVWVAGSGVVPAQPSVQTPNPAVDWRDGALQVPAGEIELAGAERPVRAGVSAFGLSGTNAHVIVEAPPAVAEPAASPTGPRQTPYVLLASASDTAGLHEQAAAWRAAAAEAGPELDALLASAATRRTHETHRFAAVAADRDELLAALADPAEPPDGAYTGHVVDAQDVAGPAFVFAGQGGQWAGMALDLYAADPTVRQALDDCADLVRAEGGWSLLDELRRAPEPDRPDRIATVQPAIFAVQVALARWLDARGVRPAAVVGHSLGEAAAAHVAGALSLPDAVRLIVRRSEILAGFTGVGAMLAVPAAPDEVQAALDAADGGAGVEIVAINGPASVILAGSAEAVTGAEAVLDAAGLRHRRLRVDAPAHSSLVRPGGAELERALAGIEPRRPDVRLLSSVEPGDAPALLDGAYWARNFTSPVRLWPAVEQLLAAEDHPLIEIGPHPVLLTALADTQRALGRRAPAVGLLDRALPGSVALHRALARLHVAGVAVDWDAAVGRPAVYRTLPVPSWREGRYWLPGVARGQQGGAGASGVAAPSAVRVSLLDEQGRVTRELYASTDTALGEVGPADVTARPSQSPAVKPASENPAAAASVLNPGGSLVDFIDATVRELLGLTDDDPALGRRRGLFEQGLDSLRSMALRVRLQERLGVELPTTIVLEHPSIRGLAEHLAEAFPGIATAPTVALPAAAENSAAPDVNATNAADAIAVIGMACRLPGADSPEAFWTLLAAGTRTTADTPAGRRDDPVWHTSRAGLPPRGSYLDDIAGFDAPFFRISPREAKTLDPQQRLFLEVAWEALENAGCPAGSLAGRPVGVFAGVAVGEYQHLVARVLDSGGEPGLHHGTGTSPATLSGRLSYLLGLQGPSISVDTACSSSLTAVHLACRALESGDCETAVVGGVYTHVAPTPLMASMSGSGALAPDGACKTFDEDADGFGIGEGAVVLILKPLSAARRDGDRVHAVLTASAVNQDGATGGMTVPNGAAQAALVRAALDRAGWAPADVDYVEAHGTGTPLGDPIEVRALAEALGPGRDGDAPLLVGAAKANIGHLGAAAGAAGLLKVVLALREGVLPPHPLSRPSTRIAWDQLPVTPVGELREWPRRGRPARAGVSAFGFSGTNVHVLVEQAPAVAPEPEPTDDAPSQVPYLLPVSAATPTALRTVAARMAAFLRERPGDVAGIVATAAHRRSLLEYRAVAIGADAGELAEALERVAVGKPHERVRTGRAEPGEQLTVAFRYAASAPDDLAAATRTWAALGIVPDAVIRPADPAVAAWLPEDPRILIINSATEVDRVLDVPGTDDAAATAAELIAHGFRPAPPRRTGPVVELPPYPWEHQPYWYRDDLSPDRAESVLDPGSQAVWTLAADSAPALARRARCLADFVRGDARATPSAVMRALTRPTASANGSGRAQPHRLAATGADSASLLAGLDALTSGTPLPTSAYAALAPHAADPVLVFPGQGWQWAGMGRDLLDASPVFARTIAECSAVVESLAEWSLLEALREGRELDRVDIVQPTMFAVLVGLARTWEALGVTPAAVVGHSQGEIAAACVAGVLDLPEATRIVVARSTALRALVGGGAMVSVAADADRAAAWLPEGWSVAALNGPQSTVVCGPAEHRDLLVERCQAEDVRGRIIPVDYASHSADVERIRPDLLERLGTVACHEGRTALYSTVTGELIDGSSMDADYWYENLRRPVRFQTAVEALAAAGHSVFIESSAHPVLLPAIEQTLDQSADKGATAVIGTLRRDADAVECWHRAAGRAWTAGVDLRLRTLAPAAPDPAPIELPDLDRPDPQAAAATRGRDADEAIERRFWWGVERGEAADLAATLGLDADQAAALADVLPSLAAWRKRARELATVDGWRYRSVWTPAPDPGPGRSRGTWLLAVPADLTDDPWVRACRNAVPDHVLLPVAAGNSRADLAEHIAKLAPEPLAGVLSLLALDEEPHPDHPAVPAGLLGTAALVQALDDAGLEARLWSLTRAAVATGPEEAVRYPLAAHVAGLSRAVGVEDPARWAGIVDLPEVPDPAAVARLAAVLTAEPAEDQVAIRHGATYVRRLIPAPASEPETTATTTVEGAAPAQRWTPSGTCLITGGTGALGGHVGRWLARHGAGHLLLLSRAGLDAPGAAALAEELTGLGTTVTVRACDVSSPEELAEAIAAIPAEHPLTAVFHTAGVVDDAPVADLTGDSAQRVLAPKSAGVRALHEATLGHALTAFVSFSSFSSMLPNVGQGAYAAGNAYLDAFAHWRRAEGLPALSVSWGAWAGGGMAADPGFTALIARGGMDLMTAHLAVTALHQALERGDTTVTVAAVDWARFADLFGAGRRYPLVAELIADAAGPGLVTATSDPGPAFRERISALPERQRFEEVLAAVCAEVAVVLGHAGARDVLPDRAFRDLGFDSVTAIELRNRLVAATGARVQPTAIFDHPTPESLTEHVLELLLPSADAEDSVVGGTDGSGGPDGRGDGPDAQDPDNPESPDRFAAMDLADLLRTARQITS